MLRCQLCQQSYGRCLRDRDYLKMRFRAGLTSVLFPARHPPRYTSPPGANPPGDNGGPGGNGPKLASNRQIESSRVAQTRRAIKTTMSRGCSCSGVGASCRGRLRSATNATHAARQFLDCTLRRKNREQPLTKHDSYAHNSLHTVLRDFPQTQQQRVVRQCT
jgi:hypothetical protein